MGGTSGEVRGKSKIDTYLEYVDLVEKLGEVFPDHDPRPANKKHCKREMVLDSETREWVLHYRLHT